MRIFYTLLFVFFVHFVTAQNELKVLGAGNGKWLEYTDAPNALYHHLAAQAYSHLSQRGKAVAAISSLPDWQERQRWIKQKLLEIAGPFPEKTPLNAKVMRVLKKETYRIEHIVFESQPGFYVTSSLFIPSGLRKKDTAPAIIYCSGHANEGYRSEVYQTVIINLVKKGFIVFAFDPVGQGERLEYYDADKGKSAIGGPTSEHSYPGTQAFITGSAQARYMIWDGIRAVDYLLTRKEVDPARIGITGRSGGGTQTAYIAAMDERIKAAAPECYITNFTRLLQSIGPQDAEQNLPHFISEGLDHGDFLLVRAPNPTLMITTTRDMFSIQGARETALEVSRIYQAYDQKENFGMVEDDAPHASTKKNREAMYAFFQKHLNMPGTATDEDVVILNPEEIKVTPSGQLLTSLQGETVFSLNRRGTEEKLKGLSQSRKNLTQHIAFVSEEARSLAGYQKPVDPGTPVFMGRIQRNGYAVEKYFLQGEGNYVIPYLLMIPDKGTSKTLLYLHPAGKEAEASPGGEMEWLVREGFRVLAPDVLGVGEMGDGDFSGDAFIDGISHNVWYASLLIGRSIVGIQAGDIARLIATVKSNSADASIYAMARKEMTPLLIHSAAFIPDIKAVALFEPLLSYRSVVMNRFYESAFIMGAVPAALTAYDLPDLAATIAPRKLLIVGKFGNASEDLLIIGRGYENAQAQDQYQTTDEISSENFGEVMEAWIK